MWIVYYKHEIVKYMMILKKLVDFDIKTARSTIIQSTKENTRKYVKWMESIVALHKIKPVDLKVQTIKQNRKAQTIVGKLSLRLAHMSCHVKDVNN